MTEYAFLGGASLTVLLYLFCRWVEHLCRSGVSNSWRWLGIRFIKAISRAACGTWRSIAMAEVWELTSVYVFILLLWSSLIKFTSIQVRNRRKGSWSWNHLPTATSRETSLLWPNFLSCRWILNMNNGPDVNHQKSHLKLVLYVWVTVEDADSKEWRVWAQI